MIARNVLQHGISRLLSFFAGALFDDFVCIEQPCAAGVFAHAVPITQ
jgi:hypothetical protein